jgi:hypothetical protein
VRSGEEGKSEVKSVSEVKGEGWKFGVRKKW